MASQVAPWVKSPFAMQQMQVRSLGWEGGGHGNPLKYFAWRISVDRGVWWATVHGVAKSWTRLNA